VFEEVANFKANGDGLNEPSELSVGAIPKSFFIIINFPIFSEDKDYTT
jgi:hypothetical protein